MSPRIFYFGESIVLYRPETPTPAGMLVDDLEPKEMPLVVIDADGDGEPVMTFYEVKRFIFQ